MKLSDLKQTGAFVDNNPVMTKVTIKGQEVEVGILRLGYAELVRLSVEPKDVMLATLIHRCVQFEGGEHMSYEDATLLDRETADAFVAAVGELNQLGPKE